MLAAEMLRPGDVVCDPFGGIASGGIIAAGLGLRWYGCELEEKFWKLGNANIEMHRALWEQFGDPVPVLVNGDSRKLRENLYAAKVIGKNHAGLLHRDTEENDCAGGGVAGIVSSPPYAGNEKSDYRIKDESGLDRDERRGFRQGQGCFRGSETYGKTPGNLGGMDDGNVDAVISSPPYASSLTGDNSQTETAAESQAKRVTPGGSLGASCRHSGYGGPGNLGNLEAGEVSAVVTSPPFEGVVSHQDENFTKRLDGTRIAGAGDNYGCSEGQLGASSGETFWHAARDIVQECHAILKPGGYAAFVVKAFVRNKSIVDFPGDWRKLCEACGFECVKEVRAMLVKEERHSDLFGGEDHVKKTARKSFFRRLYEKRFPENSIDWECVQFFRKPLFTEAS